MLQIITPTFPYVNDNAARDSLSALLACHIIVSIGQCVIMEVNDFGERLAKLISIKGFSSREMSLSMGKSSNYINKIENGKSFPSMKSFFDICEILEVSPQEFFDIDNKNPQLVNDLFRNYNRLGAEEQAHVSGVVESMARSAK